jgi:hypothetical protein
MLKPLTPKVDPVHLDWEERVMTSMQERFELARTDAQAIAEGQPKTMEAGWRYRWNPERTADAVMRSAQSKPAQSLQR